MMRIGQGANKSNTSIGTHVVENWHHATELFNALLYLAK